MFGSTAKLTVSIKRRLSNGDEVFLAPGIEMHCGADELDAKQAEVTERVNSWLEELLEAYPDADPLDEEEDEGDDEEEDEEAEEEAEEEEEDDLTPEDIAKMKKADIQALAEEYEIELESSKVAEMREELIEALFDDEEEDEGEDEEEEDEGDDEEDDLTAEDLKAMKLDELQAVCDEWEIDHPVIKKGAKLAAKKTAYIEHILEAQEEE